MTWLKEPKSLFERLVLATETIAKVLNYFPVRADIHFKRRHGMTVGTISLKVGDSVPVAMQELRADGSIYVPAKGDVTLSVQDPNLLGLVDNGDGTGVLTALAEGATNVGGVDSVTKLSAQGTVTISPVVVVPPPPVGAQIVFGDIVSPQPKV